VRTNSWFVLLAALLCCADRVAAAVPSGPQKRVTGCSTCHRSEASTQPATLMAQAMQVAGANPTLQAHPRLTFRRGGYTYTVNTTGAQTIYSVTDGVHTLSVPLQWGFGAGAQTWLFSMNGKFYESMVSYFPKVNGLAMTLGDDVFAPHSLLEALGRELGPQDVKSCFGCHTTGVMVDGKLELTAFKPGVTCEHCHTGAPTHMADALQAKFSSIPAKLGAMSSENLSNFCGQCHRSWSTVVTHLWFGEVNVRFAPYRLANSKCFNGTDARISCVACHNPHVNVETVPAAYDTKCLACHTAHPLAVGQTPIQSSPEAPRATRVCPVGTSNCVSCHMPKVKLADGNLTFTDHFIRVVKTGEPYPH
jgi:formate-dependent nitrite reductase cytochrome c552 subunit